MNRQFGVFSAAVFVLAACSDASGPTAHRETPVAPTTAIIVDPDPTYPFPSTVVPNPNPGLPNPGDGWVRVCKVSNVAGTFNFDFAVNGAVDGIADFSITIAAGQENVRVCRPTPIHNSDLGSGALDVVNVVELDPGANFAVVVDVEQHYVATVPDYHPNALADQFDNTARSATAYINDDLEKVVVFRNTFTPPQVGAVLLIIDEDGIDNGLHFNAAGGLITPGGPNFFSVSGVNDDKPGKTQRDVLRYFATNVGRTITVRTGQTGDEGWFAPNCIPAKFIASYSKENNTCLSNGARQTGIANYFGANGASAIPQQDRLDKIPHLIPLRALGLNSLIGKTVCAVVYDSDVSVNYDHDKPDMGVNGNLTGETLGIVAFDVNLVRTLTGFSSSTLPQVTITIRSTSVCGNWVLFKAPVPASSSVPNDRFAPGSPSGYRVVPAPPLFY